MTTEPKKLAPLRILQILQKYSSPNHPLLQEEIAERLHEYGIDLERKAIGRNLACLSDAGFDVVNIPKRGYYLETLGFDAFDLCLIVDAILCSEHITEDRAGELLYKLKSLTHDTLPFVANRVERLDERSEDDLWDLFTALQRVSFAIGAKMRIEFDYTENAEKRHCRAIPRRIFLSERTYYLLAYDRGRYLFYRLDRMSRTRALLPGRNKYPRRDKKAEESAIEAFFHGAPHDETESGESLKRRKN